MRAREIYEGLRDKWEEKCADGVWIKEVKKMHALEESDWTPDCFFLVTTSWGPWQEKKQLKVWNKVRIKYPQVVRNICKADKNFKVFPFDWQDKRIIALADYLNRKAIVFKDLIEELKPYDGIRARDYLAEIVGAYTKKTISCFVRDFLKKDSFPIDARVNEMLSNLGLPVNEDLMVELCKQDRVNSRILERMLYSQQEDCRNNECVKCKINDYCWKYILNRD